MNHFNPEIHAQTKSEIKEYTPQELEGKLREIYSNWVKDKANKRNGKQLIGKCVMFESWNLKTR